MQATLTELTQYLAGLPFRVQVSMIVFGTFTGIFAMTAYKRYYRSGRRFLKQPFTLVVLTVVSLLSIGTGVYAMMAPP